MLGINRARWLVTGAAPIAPELIEWYWSMGVPMFEAYGQTECSGLATTNVPGDCRFGSIGKPIAGNEIRISEEGEILIRSPGVIKGYLNKPDKTAETIRDGWLHTGDLLRRDSDGYYYFVGRRDDMINVGGENVYPNSSS